MRPILFSRISQKVPRFCLGLCLGKCFPNGPKRACFGLIGFNKINTLRRRRRIRNLMNFATDGKHLSDMQPGERPQARISASIVVAPLKPPPSGNFSRDQHSSVSSELRATDLRKLCVYYLVCSTPVRPSSHGKSGQIGRNDRFSLRSSDVDSVRCRCLAVLGVYIPLRLASPGWDVLKRALAIRPRNVYKSWTNES